MNTYSKKHGQLKEAVVKMVDAGMAILEELRAGEGKLERGYMENDQKADRWLDLVDCLRDITEGKVSGHPKYTSEYQRMLTGDRGIRYTWSFSEQG